MPTRLFGYRAGMNIASLGGTFSRASTKVVANAAGLLTTVASGTLADGHYIGGKRYALLEGARTNLFLQSVFPGSGALPTGWSQGLSTGSQSLVASSLGNADGAQALTLSASAGRQTITQTVTLAASTQYTISVNIEASSGTLSTYVLRVNTNVASVQGAVGGTGSVIAAQGLLQITPGYVGRASLTFTTDATGGSIVIQYGVGTTGNDTGSITISRPQLEAAPFASSYIPTTGATATRAADSLSFPFTAVPQAMTVYVKGVEYAVGQPSSVYHVNIGGQTGAFFRLWRASLGYRTDQTNGTTNISSQFGTLDATMGQAVEIRSVVNADGSVQTGESIAGGNETLSTASAANTLAGSWGSPTLYLGSLAGTVQGFFAFESVVVAAGVQSLASMRSLASTPVAAVQPIPTTVTVSPSSFSVVAGQSQQLSVTVLDQFGAAMSSQTPVTWSSSNGSVASVSSTGLVSALGAGSATITASCGAASGTASGTITAAPVLTTVTVSPSTASASAGSTIQFTATGQDQFGATMAGLTFSWSSSTPTKATVDSSGLASCIASGTVTITATSGSVSGSATLTIPAVNAQPAFTITYDNEPASMVAWQDRAFSTTPENSWSDSTITRLSFVDPTTDPDLSTWPADWSKGKSPAKVGKILFPTTMSGGQAPITTGKAENSAFYTEIYHTIFVAVDPNWRGAGVKNVDGSGNFLSYSGSGVNKLFHYWMGDGAAGIDPTWPGVSGNSNRLYLMLNGRWDEDLKVEMRCQQCPKGVGFNDTWDSDHDGSFNLPSNLGTTAQRIVTRGVLNKIEVHAILNTPGVSDGLVEWWLNGVKIGSYSGLIWLNSALGRRWRDIQLSPTYGGTEVPPQTQYIAIDHAYSKRK